MRRLLGMLRRPDEPLELAPPPSLLRLDALIGGVREAGLHVDVRREGQPVPLPSSLDLNAYRIVQEGLTNVVKHALGSRVGVVLRYGKDDLVVEILDDGVGPSRNGDGGHGLEGMRERVALYGGWLEAGAGPGGGFALRVRLPLRG